MKHCPNCENEVGFFKGLKTLKSKRVALIFKKANESYMCMSCGVTLRRKWSQLVLTSIGFLFSGYTYFMQTNSNNLIFGSAIFAMILFILIAVAIKGVCYEKVA